MRGLMLLCIMMLAGDAMGAPRGLIRNTKDALNNRLRSAPQEARYAPEAWVRPATLDAASATSTTSVSTAGVDESAWIASRVKGVVVAQTYNAVQVVVDYTTAATVTGKVTVALCRYDDTNPERLVIREVTRGVLSSEVAAPGAGGVREVVRLNQPAELVPGEKYALAVRFSVSGAGSVALSSSAGRAEAFSFRGLTADEAFNVDFDGVDRATPFAQIGGNPVLMTLVNDTDTEPARNIKNWY